MAVKTIRELIEQQAILQKKFLIDPITEEYLEYPDLLVRVENFQKFMDTIGFKKGNKVAIALKNSIEAAVCILGVMYCGGVVVPVNLGWKEREFTYILDNSDSRFLVTADGILNEAGVSLTEKRKCSWEI